MSNQVPGQLETAQWLQSQGLNYTQISEVIGVSVGTLYRWFSPEAAERDRASSRAYKQRNKGTCIDCGGPTAYSDRSRKKVLRCDNCNRIWKSENKQWTQATVIDAIQRFAAIHGRPPVSTEWIKADHENNYPPRSAVYQSNQKGNKPFPRWADAIEAAGFPRPVVGHKQLQWNERSQKTGKVQKAILALFDKRERLIVPVICNLLPQYQEGSIRAAVHSLERRGSLKRVHRGVYALNKSEDTDG